MHAQEIELSNFSTRPEEKPELVINKDEPLPLRYDGTKANVPFMYRKWLLKQQFTSISNCM